jgi:hypothetical protein
MYKNPSSSEGQVSYIELSAEGSVGADGPLCSS